MSISANDFHVAAKGLSDTRLKLEDQSSWEQVQLLTLYGSSYLRITKPLPAGEDQNARRDSSESAADLALHEVDEEALPVQQHPTSASPRVIYDIVHSPSYQVPVLYLTFKDFPSGARPSLDEVYDLLVPAAHQSQLESVGVMGALSMAEHPVTGTPAYFVHPCRTQEAMLALVTERTVKPQDYLLLWLGVIGGGVGLNMPIELAQMVGASSGR